MICTTRFWKIDCRLLWKEDTHGCGRNGSHIFSQSRVYNNTIRVKFIIKRIDIFSMGNNYCIAVETIPWLKK